MEEHEFESYLKLPHGRTSNHLGFVSHRNERMKRKMIVIAKNSICDWVGQNPTIFELSTHFCLSPCVFLER